MIYQEFIANMPGYFAIKDKSSKYIALSNDASKDIFGLKDFRNNLMDYDIPGSMSLLSEAFIESDKEVIETQQTLKAINIGKWTDNLEGALIAEKKPFYVGESLEGVFISATKLNNDIFSLFRTIINSDLVKKIRDVKNCELSLNKKYCNLTSRSQVVLFFLLYGLSNKEIAVFLNCSHRTIEHNIDELKSIFAVDKKNQIVEAAISQGYALDIPDFITNKPMLLEI